MKKAEKQAFDPKPTKYPFPEDTDRHYITVKKDNHKVFDRSYPYVDRSFFFMLRHYAVRAMLFTIVFPMTRVRLGLKIEGRKNLKKHKNELKNGAVTCSNHAHFWDYLAVMRAILPHDPYLLVWDRNVRGESSALIRSVGGIPIPTDSPAASAAFLKAVKGVLDEGKWLHIYPEGSMWEYYRPIRPFKTGAAYFARKENKPLLPLGFSYRKPGWIRRKIFKQTALFTLRIGEPLYADPSLPPTEQEKDLVARSHAAVCRLAGMDPAESLYEPVYNNSKRIDYYTTEYGVK